MYRECLNCDKLGVSCDGPNLIVMPPYELREWLKKRKTAKGYTNASISELSGVPKGTVDRFFASDTVDCKHETLNPIIRTLIGGEFTASPCPDPTADAKQADEIIMLKKEIGILQSKLDKTEELFIAERAAYKEEAQKKIEYLKIQSNRLRKTAIIMTALLIAVMFGIIGFLSYDILHPGIGWLS